MTANELPSPDRRRFLTTLLAATAGSVATGSVLALLDRPSAPIAAGPAPQPVAIEASPAVINEAPAQELLGRLAAAQAENVRLKAELDSAQRRLSLVEQGAQETGGELEILRGELAESDSRAGLLAGMLALYEQLEEIDVGETVSQGINSVAENFAELALSLPGLAEDLAEGELALSAFESDLPALEAGRAWLGEQLGRLGLAWELVEQRLRESLEAVEPILDMIQRWFDKLLGWVPFEWGNRTRQVMGAVFGLLEETPRTIEGGQREVLVSLDRWLKPEPGEIEPAVRTRLLKPIRERTIGSARRTADQVERARNNFQKELVVKTATVVADRQEIRRQISRFRQENGL